MRTCSVSECGRIHYGKGLCKLHYRRLYERGSLDLIGYRVPHRHSDPVARFWAKVDKNGPIHPTLRTACWLWTGALSNGYGRFWDGTRLVTAHSYSYGLANSPIPLGLFGLHKCDNPPCVNPAHIWAGDQGENVRDAIAKGRWAPWNACRRTVAPRPRLPHRNVRAEQRRAATHCARGHEFTPENTAPHHGGRCRKCRACMKLRREARKLLPPG